MPSLAVSGETAQTRSPAGFPSWRRGQRAGSSAPSLCPQGAAAAMSPFTRTQSARCGTGGAQTFPGSRHGRWRECPHPQPSGSGARTKVGGGWGRAWKTVKHSRRALPRGVPAISKILRDLQGPSPLAPRRGVVRPHSSTPATAASASTRTDVFVPRGDL